MQPPRYCSENNSGLDEGYIFYATFPPNYSLNVKDNFLKQAQTKYILFFLFAVQMLASTILSKYIYKIISLENAK